MRCTLLLREPIAGFSVLALAYGMSATQLGIASGFQLNVLTKLLEDGDLSSNVTERVELESIC